jgi:hypothetical protein
VCLLWKGLRIVEHSCKSAYNRLLYGGKIEFCHQFWRYINEETRIFIQMVPIFFFVRVALILSWVDFCLFVPLWYQNCLMHLQ